MSENVADAPALGMSLQVDLGAGRVCTLQTFLPNDCSTGALNRMLDKMTEAGARQRAAYKIEELERDLEKLEREQAQHKEDLEHIERDFDAAQTQRTGEIQKALSSADNYEVQAKADWDARGRRGPFELKGSDKANVDRVRKSVDAAKAEMAAKQAERDKVVADSQKTFERRQELIAKAQAEMARCRETVASGLKE